MKLNDVLNEKKKSAFEVLKDNKVPLTPEERKECIDKKAVWHFHHGTVKNRKTNTTPAIWKSKKKDGSFVYVAATHRAYQVRDTLKGAISIFHSFIKGTA